MKHIWRISTFPLLSIDHPSELDVFSFGEELVRLHRPSLSHLRVFDDLTSSLVYFSLPNFNPASLSPLPLPSTSSILEVWFSAKDIRHNFFVTLDRESLLSWILLFRWSVCNSVLLREKDSFPSSSVFRVFPLRSNLKACFSIMPMPNITLSSTSAINRYYG